MGLTCECNRDFLAAEASKELNLSEEFKPVKRRFNRSIHSDLTRRDTEASQEFSTDFSSLISPKFSSTQV